MGPITAAQAANAILDLNRAAAVARAESKPRGKSKSGDDGSAADRMTSWRLHLLIYFMHGYHLAILGKPLLREPVMQFPSLPAVASLFSTGEGLNSQPRNRVEVVGSGSCWALGEPVEPPAHTMEFVEWILDLHDETSNPALDFLATRQGTPWCRVRDMNRGTYPLVIPDDMIWDHFTRMLAEEGGE